MVEAAEAVLGVSGQANQHHLHREREQDGEEQHEADAPHCPDAAALRPVLEGYQRENKRHSVVAIGCTGGKHRSVVMARELAARLPEVAGVAVRVKDRDLGRE